MDAVQTTPEALQQTAQDAALRWRQQRAADAASAWAAGGRAARSDPPFALLEPHHMLGPGPWADAQQAAEAHEAAGQPVLGVAPGPGGVWEPALVRAAQVAAAESPPRRRGDARGGGAGGGGSPGRWLMSKSVDGQLLAMSELTARAISPEKLAGGRARGERRALTRAEEEEEERRAGRRRGQREQRRARHRSRRHRRRSRSQSRSRSRSRSGSRSSGDASRTSTSASSSSSRSSGSEDEGRGGGHELRRRRRDRERRRRSVRIPSREPRGKGRRRWGGLGAEEASEQGAPRQGGPVTSSGAVPPPLAPLPPSRALSRSGSAAAARPPGPSRQDSRSSAAPGAGTEPQAGQLPAAPQQPGKEPGEDWGLDVAERLLAQLEGEPLRPKGSLLTAVGVPLPGQEGEPDAGPEGGPKGAAGPGEDGEVGAARGSPLGTGRLALLPRREAQWATPSPRDEGGPGTPDSPHARMVDVLHGPETDRRTQEVRSRAWRRLWGAAGPRPLRRARVGCCSQEPANDLGLVCCAASRFAASWCAVLS